jgi:hypothetical protein
MNTYQKLTAALAATAVALVLFASNAGAESLIPTDGATDIASSFTDTVTDAWPILVALVAMGILVKVVKRFT